MPKKERSLMDRAYHALKRRIITLDLKPGQRLDDYELSRQLGISRTPVREAIFLLGAEGLVDVRSSSGFIVRPLDLIDISHLFEAHVILAKAQALLAVSRVTTEELDAMVAKAAEVERHIDARDYLAITAANAELHRMEGAATHNDILRKMADQVHDQGQRLAYLCFGGGEQGGRDLDGHFSEVKAHHAGMVEALTTRDARRAQEVAVEHVALFKRRVQQFLDSETLDDFRIGDEEIASVAFDAPGVRTGTNAGDA